MRTPDKIKKGLECCSNVNFVCNEECPYYKSLSEGEDCCLKKNADALALIQQLQAENVEKARKIQQLEATVSEKEKVVAELSGKIGQLEAERDAAVNDLHYLVNHPLSAGPCYACLHSKDCWRGGDCDPVNNDRWQWRGIYKEEH